MTLIHDNIGFTFEGWFNGGIRNLPFTVTNSLTDSDDAEIMRPYLQKLYDKGVRYLRTGILDAQQFGGGSGSELGKMAHNMGFDVHYGPSFAVIDFGSPTGVPDNHRHYSPNFLMETWFPLVLSRFDALMAMDFVDVFTLGNEHDEATVKGNDSTGKASFVPEPVTLVRTSNVVTATFPYVHYYEVGDRIVITGATQTSFNSHNGTPPSGGYALAQLATPGQGFVVTSVPTPYTLTYASVGADDTAAGTPVARMTPEVNIRLLKYMARTLRAQPSFKPGMLITYSLTSNPHAIYELYPPTPGVDLDAYSMNLYSSPGDLSNYRTIATAWATALGSAGWITETQNAGGAWEQIVGTLPTITQHERPMRDRLKILKDLNIPRVYFFKADSEPRSKGWSGGYETMNYLGDMGPRNSYYTIFAERRDHYITAPSRDSYNKNLSTPYYAMKRLKRPVDRGKCINFNQSNGYLTGNYPSSFTAANLTNFTVAIRLYPRSLGGGNLGRIISGVNQKFIELSTSSNGYDCTVWHGNTAQSVTGSGSIVFNKWQTLFIVFRQTPYKENFCRLYIDSVEYTTVLTNNSGTRGDSAGQTFSIGNRSDLVRGYDGLIDDLYVWNRVLTVKEMSAYRNGNIPGQYIFGLDMNETTGLIYDKVSGQGFTLTASDQNYPSYTAV